jgi:hypothetical protein
MNKLDFDVENSGNQQQPSLKAPSRKEVAKRLMIRPESPSTPVNASHLRPN